MIDSADKSVIAVLVAMIGAIGAIFVRGMSRRETTDERLQRWQEATVVRVNAENKDLRERVRTLEADLNRLFAVEVAYQMIRGALSELDPDNQVLEQAASMMILLRSHPTPKAMQDALDRINDGGARQ